MPSTFQQILNAVLKNVSFPQEFLGDIVVLTNNTDEHMAYLQKVVAVISGHQLKLKISKCKFAKNEVELSAITVSSDGVAVDKKNVVAIEDALASLEQTSLRSFLGLTGYY